MDLQLEMLIADVESKFIAAEDALSELRHAVRQLKSYRPPASASTQTQQSQPYVSVPIHEAPAESGNGAHTVASDRSEPETLWEPGPKLEEDTVGIPFWPGPARPEPVVPETKRVNENYGLDSTSEASWPIAKPSEPRRPEPEFPTMQRPVDAPSQEYEVAGQPQIAGEDDDEARREEVARIVAQMRGGADDEDPAEDDDEAKRHDVARMADLRDSTEVEPEEAYSNGSAPEAEDDEARRQEVARMVAEMRSGALESDETPDDSDDEAKREDVAGIVAQMRSESEPDANHSVDAEDDEEVRDEVRRAVEAARAELASGYKDVDEEKQSFETRFSFPDWQTTHMEPSGPPVIVIKDSEGRVELARVYETLSRVHCDENAALLNYTPHSVTIGLNVATAVPQVDALTEAVKSVFGRNCEVDSDGVRVNVEIGRDLKGKDSAA
jgi:hypothetical protein